MQFEGKITSLTRIEGTNRYGEPYKGWRATIVEQLMPDGQSYRNACTMFIRDSGQTICEGDVGTVECFVDIKQGQNGAYNTIQCRNFKITREEGTF